MIFVRALARAAATGVAAGGGGWWRCGDALRGDGQRLHVVLREISLAIRAVRPSW
jgi:hypothetical protein